MSMQIATVTMASQIPDSSADPLLDLTVTIGIDGWCLRKRTEKTPKWQTADVRFTWLETCLTHTTVGLDLKF